MSAGSGREDQETRRSVPRLGVDTLAWPSDRGVEGFSVPACLLLAGMWWECLISTTRLTRP